MSDCDPMWDDCSAVEQEAKTTSLEDRTDEEWEEAFAEHGMLHFVEYMESANPHSGQIAFIVGPALLASWYLVVQYTMRKDIPGTSDNYWSYYSKALSSRNLWEKGWKVKVWGSATLMVLLAVYELVNAFAKLPIETTIMIWVFTSMIIGVLDLTYYIMNLLGQKRMYDAYIANGTYASNAQSAQLSMQIEVVTVAVMETIFGMWLMNEEGNWLAAQLMPYYEEAKAAHKKGGDDADEKMEELEGLVKKYVSL